MKTTYLLLLSSNLLLFLQSTDAGNTEVRSGDSGTISLAEVTAAALANNPAIKEAIRKWNAAKARIPQAAAWDDLRVGGESRVRRFVDIPPNAFMDQVVSIEQSIPLTGKNLARARSARAEAVSVYEELRRQQLDVIAATRSAFFTLSNAHAQIDLNQQNVVSLRQIADISRTKYEAGTEPAADVLVAETEATKSLETERDLERLLSEAEAQLNALMGRDAFVPIGIPQEVALSAPLLSPTKLRPLILEHRPEVKMAAAKIDLEKANLQFARRQWIPDPALSVKAQRYNDAAQTVSEVDAGVSFSVPWFNFKKYGAQVREAEENISAAEQALERAQQEALRLLRDQLTKIDTTHHHVELFRDKLVPQARQAFEANRLNYESGKASFLDWITSQRNLRDLEARGRQHLADYQTAIAELEAIVGTSFHPLPNQAADNLQSRDIKRSNR